MREAECVQHKVPLMGPECGPTCEELTKQVWLAGRVATGRGEEERGS